MPITSSSSCTVPSSPSRPCRATKAASGRSAISSVTRSGPTSMGRTSWPRRSSASCTLAPDRSDTWRSSERPPFSTATRLKAALGPPTASPRALALGGELQDLGQLGIGHARLGLEPCVLTAARSSGVRLRAGQGPVHGDLLTDDLADAPDAFTDLVLAHAREVQPHRGPTPPVDVGRASGHERDVLLKGAGQQVGGV